MHTTSTIDYGIVLASEIDLELDDRTEIHLKAGPESLTLPKITSILSRVLDRSIEYVQVTVKSIQQQLALAGATPDVRRELGNLFRALGNPDGIYATARTPEAFTSTTFEQFAIHKLLKHI